MGIRGELATYLCPPSTGLPGCRRPPSGPFRLGFDLRGCLVPPGFGGEVRAFPEAPLAAGMELTVVDAIELRPARNVDLRTLLQG